MSIAANIASLRQRMNDAARRAGRSPDEITLMAVSKTVDPGRIREAYADGIRALGENRVQEFQGKMAALTDLNAADWHLIGHLQTNKIAAAAESFGAIDSIDSLRLAEKLNVAAAKLGKRIPILIEINVGSERSKSGFAPDSAEFEQLLKAAPRLDHLEVRGLMSIPPFNEDPQAARPYFRRLRDFSNQVSVRKLPAVMMDTLSMGMSHDFEVAIEEGSTCVRIGTLIFGERQKK